MADDVEVVIVVRDHYSSTMRTVLAVVDTVDAPVRVTLVPGATPDRAIKSIVAATSGRVRCIGPHHHQIPNVARQIGLHGATAHYVAFVDNDVVPEPGWLDKLMHTASEHAATAVRPLILQSFGNDDHITIHESGGDCAIGIGPRGRTLVERHRHMNDPVGEARHLKNERVQLLEFHCVLFDRQRLLAVGGFDTAIESQGEHLDLALRIAGHQESIWLAPDAQATVEFRHGLAPMDIGLYLGRWSPRLNDRSRSAFNATWGITDPNDAPSTWGYAEQARVMAWLPLGRVAHRLIRRSSPAALAQRFDQVLGRHIANGVLGVAPAWKAWRKQAALKPAR